MRPWQIFSCSTTRRTYDSESSTRLPTARNDRQAEQQSKLLTELVKTLAYLAYRLASAAITWYGIKDTWKLRLRTTTQSATMNVTKAALAAYIEGLQARLLACKARSGSGDAESRPLPPAIPPPLLPEGVEIYGRIFNTLDLATKERIHDDPGMAFVWVFGPDCLPTLGSVSGVWALWKALGVPEDRLVDHLFVKGTRPDLMLLPLARSAPGGDPLTPYDATWDGVGAIVERTYPRVAEAVLYHLDAFRRGGEAYYDELESSVPPEASPRFTPSDGRRWGFWACLSNEGLARGAYLGYDELSAAVAAGGGYVQAWQARLFLYCQLRMTREFTGSGHTTSHIDEKGNVTPGLREFLLPNASVTEVKAAGGVFTDLAPFADVPRDVLERSLTLPFAGRYTTTGVER